LFKSHDPNFVNVSQGRLLPGVALNGEGGKRAGLLEGERIETDEVINRIVSDAKVC